MVLLKTVTISQVKAVKGSENTCHCQLPKSWTCHRGRRWDDYCNRFSAQETHQEMR